MRFLQLLLGTRAELLAALLELLLVALLGRRDPLGGRSLGALGALEGSIALSDRAARDRLGSGGTQRRLAGFGGKPLDVAGERLDVVGADALDLLLEPVGGRAGTRGLAGGLLLRTRFHQLLLSPYGPPSLPIGGGSGRSLLMASPAGRSRRS